MRTHFSDQIMLTQIRLNSIDDISFMLEYLMWETSTDTIIGIGTPTYDDICEWIRVLECRLDRDTDQVQQCIDSCKEYIKP